MGYLNGNRYLQSVVRNSQRHQRSSEESVVSHRLEGLLFFHGPIFIKSHLEQRSVSAVRNVAAQTEIPIGILNRMILKAFSPLFPVYQLSPMSRVIAPYLIFHRQFVPLTILSLCVNGLLPLRRIRLSEMLLVLCTVLSQ